MLAERRRVGRRRTASTRCHDHAAAPRLQTAADGLRIRLGQLEVLALNEGYLERRDHSRPRQAAHAGRSNATVGNTATSAPSNLVCDP